VGRLEGAHGPQLCMERPCMRITTMEVSRYPGDIEEKVSELPPPLCESCPYREGGGPIRHVEVVKRYRDPPGCAKRATLPRNGLLRYISTISLRLLPGPRS
jgi:hypothetical protein